MTTGILCPSFWLFMLLSMSPLTGVADSIQSGITLHSLRVIYPESAKKGVTISLTNNTDQVYLMQSWMRSLNFSEGQIPAEVEGTDNTASTLPFIITPPLKRVDVGEKLTLLIRKASNDLPTDRESVFFISIKAIPSIPDNTGLTGNQMIVTIVNNIKIFYRPMTLPVGGIKDANKLLRFSRQGDQLVASNPTPFYLTFSNLTVGGYTVPPSELRNMVPPKGQQDYFLPKTVHGDVQWKLLDEHSEPTPIQTSSF